MCDLRKNEFFEYLKYFKKVSSTNENIFIIELKVYTYKKNQIDL